jgi:hypothetical protein
MPKQFFYVSRGSLGTTVYMDVFCWQKGQWWLKKETVQPGDPIGSMENDVDFNTSTTLVDLRSQAAGADSYLLLMNKDTGKLFRRDFKSDQLDAQYAQLKEWVARGPVVPPPAGTIASPTPSTPEGSASPETPSTPTQSEPTEYVSPG